MQHRISEVCLQFCKMTVGLYDRALCKVFLVWKFCHEWRRPENKVHFIQPGKGPAQTTSHLAARYTQSTKALISHMLKKHAHKHHKVWHCSQQNRSLYLYVSKYCRRQKAEAAKTFGQSASLKDIYSSEQRELMHWFEAERGKWRKSLSQVIACSKTSLLFFWVFLSVWLKSLHIHTSHNNWKSPQSLREDFTSNIWSYSLIDPQSIKQTIIVNI